MAIARWRSRSRGPVDIPAAEAEEVLRRYQQEVQVYALLQKVGTPNIVPVYTVKPYAGTMLLSMAYMAGGDGDALIPC